MQNRTAKGKHGDGAHGLQDQRHVTRLDTTVEREAYYFKTLTR